MHKPQNKEMDEHRHHIGEDDESEAIVDKPNTVRKLLDSLLKKTEEMEQRLARILEDFDASETKPES